MRAFPPPAQGFLGRAVLGTVVLGYHIDRLQENVRRGRLNPLHPQIQVAWRYLEAIRERLCAANDLRSALERSRVYCGHAPSLLRSVGAIRRCVNPG
jgi:hypothetical protein